MESFASRALAKVVGTPFSSKTTTYFEAVIVTLSMAAATNSMSRLESVKGYLEAASQLKIIHRRRCPVRSILPSPSVLSS